MRLLNLFIEEYNVLKDLAIEFSSASSDYRRGYDIDFLVGLNGSGKSTILRLLAEIFLRLEGASGSQNTIPFGFTLTYSTVVGEKERVIGITNQDEEDKDRPFNERMLRVTLDQ